MVRLVTICAAVVLACVLIGGYLADDNVARSIVEAVPTKSEHVLSASDSKLKVETTDETAEDPGDAADETDSSDEDDSANDGDVANTAPADDDSGGQQPASDPWNPGDAPGKPGK
ncbi:MAG TPA: hypothetical protein VGF43_23350 [Dongiaceae bacterium]|jgi:hypothetical protein